MDWKICVGKSKKSSSSVGLSMEMIVKSRHVQREKHVEKRTTKKSHVPREKHEKRTTKNVVKESV